jgi:hypothetical protein
MILNPSALPNPLPPETIISASVRFTVEEISSTTSISWYGKPKGCPIRFLYNLPFPRFIDIALP